MDIAEGWERLARLVRARRHERGWTQVEVATRGGLSLDRVQAIESARSTSYSGRTLAKLERGLEWTPGSVRAVVEEGGMPTPEAPKRETADQIADEVEDDLADMGRQIGEALERRRGRPLTETQRKVVIEWADTLERTVEAMDEEAG